jgi:LysM repeat protein
MNTGKIATVEAKCTRCGTGMFTRRWNKLGTYRVLRNNTVYADVPNSKKIFKHNEASAAVTTYTGNGTNYVAPTIEERPVEIIPPTRRPEIKPEASEQTELKTYKVRAGDYPHKIAKKHGVSLQAFYGVNPGVNWRRLRVGRMVNIPQGGQIVSPAPTTYKTYNVRRGDYPIKIAKRFGINYKKLKKANPGINWRRLRVGQRIKIPKR